MTSKLHDYQVRAIEFGLEHPQVYYAIDMGMGKTAIILTLLRKLKQQAIVFGPLRVISTTWPDEIAKWTPELTFKVLHGPYKSLAGTHTYDILLINYEGLEWFAKQRGPWKPRIAIFDEASMVKSHSTQRFKIFQKAAALWPGHKYALSAWHIFWSFFY